jgi:hypothetical protein
MASDKFTELSIDSPLGYINLLVTETPDVPAPQTSNTFGAYQGTMNPL